MTRHAQPRRRCRPGRRRAGGRHRRGRWQRCRGAGRDRHPDATPRRRRTGARAAARGPAAARPAKVTAGEEPHGDAGPSLARRIAATAARRPGLPDSPASCSRTSRRCSPTPAPSARSIAALAARSRERRAGRPGGRHRGARLPGRRCAGLRTRVRPGAGAQGRQAAAADGARAAYDLEYGTAEIEVPVRACSTARGCCSSTTCWPPAAPCAAAVDLLARPAATVVGARACCWNCGFLRRPRRADRESPRCTAASDAADAPCRASVDLAVAPAGEPEWSGFATPETERRSATAPTPSASRR